MRNHWLFLGVFVFLGISFFQTYVHASRIYIVDLPLMTKPEEFLKKARSELRRNVLRGTAIIVVVALIGLGVWLGSRIVYVLAVIASPLAVLAGAGNIPEGLEQMKQIPHTLTTWQLFNYVLLALFHLIAFVTLLTRNTRQFFWKKPAAPKPQADAASSQSEGEGP